MIKKALREYISADVDFMTNISNVFTFFNPVNTRRVNNAVNKSAFPMMTIRESGRQLNEGHQSGNTLAFSSVLDIELDTIVDPDACTKKQISNLNNSLDVHEESCDKLVRLLHGLSGDVSGVHVGVCLFQDSYDSQAIFNLPNNDKEQIIYRKNFTFNINYEEGA